MRQNKLICVRLAILLMVMVTALVVCSSGHAFEVDRFRSGMSHKEVTDILSKMRFAKITDEGNSVRALGDYPLKPNSTFYSFAFCNGLLTDLSKSVRGTTKNLITLVEQFTRLYGQVKSVWAATSIESVGEIKSIRFTWEKSHETIDLIYSIVPDSEGISLMYKASGSCWK